MYISNTFEIMSDVELSSDSEEVKSSEDVIFNEKPVEKKDETTYDGVPVVSSDDEEPKEEKKEGLEDVQNSNEETTSEGPDTKQKKKTPEHAELNHRSKGLKSLTQKLKEKAFKKADLAGEDPELINHRLERRALAERLEEDSEFRAQYIQEQEEERKKVAEDEDESMNFSNTSELIDQVNRLQSKRRGESSVSSSDDETVPSVSHQSYSSHIVDDDDMSYSRSTQKTVKNKVKTRGAPAKAGIYIHIENLTLNL